MTKSNQNPPNKAKSRQENSLTPPRTPSEIRERIIKSLRVDVDPELLLERAKKKNILGENFDKENNQELMREIVATFSFDNDYSLAEVTPNKYHGLSIELRRKLIKDFDCSTHAEKILVDLIASAYIRVLNTNEKMTTAIGNKQTCKTLNDYLAILSKEIDRSNRHLITAFQTLTQLKRPPISVKVKTQNAFIAQAQQFNSKQHA